MSTKGGRYEAPRIGVTWISAGSEKCRRYLRAVSLAGGEAVALPEKVSSWDAALESIRGLLLTGGADIDPALYGEENVTCMATNPRRDALEMRALRVCLERGLPVVAICRGLQFVNVALGGSLIQDIQTTIRHSPEAEESSFHEIEVVPGTRLAAIAGQPLEVRVNSRHHQGADRPRVAPKLRVSALAADGIVEGLEMDGDQFLVAVQCHPEYLDQVPRLRGLFDLLVSQACRA